VSVLGRNFHASSLEGSDHGFDASGAARAVPAIVAATISKDGHLSLFMEKTPYERSNSAGIRSRLGIAVVIGARLATRPRLGIAGNASQSLFDRRRIL
jgi:hypothetical protein